jgi:hypothetical protein
VASPAGQLDFGEPAATCGPMVTGDFLGVLAAPKALALTTT